MKLTEIGEFGFIERFKHKYDHLISTNDLGIGDDCAVLSINDTEKHLITTDLLIEDIHFVKDKISPEQLGYKSLAVNLSDIAAMGAQPLYSFLSIGIPVNTYVEYLDRFMQGYYQLSEKYNTPLMGGDTTKSVDRLVINIAVFGKCVPSEMRLRSMAQSGDLICVTGNLGDSAGGLKIVLDKLETSNINKELIKRHNLPEPMVNEGLWLAKQNAVHAMIDISDGIASDLNHILKASEKSAIVELDKLPVSNSLKEACKKYSWNIYNLAAGGGEDYELLFTIAKTNYEKVNSEFKKQFNKPLYPIGEIRNGNSGIRWLDHGRKVKTGKLGFDHFG